MDLKKFKTTGEKTIYVREQRFFRFGWDIDCPAIHFAGKWLEALGFRTRDRIRLQYKPGRIVITLVDVPDCEQAGESEPTPAPVVMLYGDDTVAAEPPISYVHPGALPTTPPASPRLSAVWPSVRRIWTLDFGGVYLRSA